MVGLGPHQGLELALVWCLLANDQLSWALSFQFVGAEGTQCHDPLALASGVQFGSARQSQNHVSHHARAAWQEVRW